VGRGRISSTSDGGDRAVQRAKRSPGLEILGRDGYWHIHGTLRLAGQSKRIRKSTELPSTEANREAAQAARHLIEAEFRNEVLHGIKPTITIDVAAQSYLAVSRDRPLNEIDLCRVEEITTAFSERKINSITLDEWDAFVTKRMRGRVPSTRERYLNVLFALLTHALGKKWIDELPLIKRNPEARKPNSRKRRRVVELTLELVGLMVEAAAPHLRPQLAVMWCGGTRVSSILYGARFCDLVLSAGNEQITFHKTKNGKVVTSHLHPWAAGVLKEYIEHRGIPRDRETPLFLTDEGLPYADNEQAYGGQTKTAFKGMKRRVIARLRADGRDAEATLVAQVTPHWFRHNLATTLLASGSDLRSIMSQGGWETMESVQTYTHQVPRRQRDAVNALAAPPATSLTRDTDNDTKNADGSEG
jgi:integrase